MINVKKININIIVMENNIYNELEFLMNPELYQKYMDSKEKDISNNSKIDFY